jgi:hypothetical protein
VGRLCLRVTPQTGSPVGFDFDGAWTWDNPEWTYRTGAEPPELETVRHVWSVAGMLVLRPGGGSEVDGWTAFRTTLALFRSRDNPVVSVALVLRDGSSETEVLALGPPDVEGFRIEAVAGETYELDPAATNAAAWPFSLRFSALEAFERDFGLPDSVTVDGVVGFEQQVDLEEDAAGLSRLTAETLITTKPGTDARVKARLLGLLPRPASTWAYDTNGDTGVTLQVLDADEVSEPTRTPTRVRAVCVLQQYGLVVGTGGPGNAPGRISKTVDTRDDGDEVVAVTTAEAVGPNRETWVAGHAPGGATTETQTFNDTSSRTYRRQWTTKVSKGRPVLTQVKVTLSGGGQRFKLKEALGGFDPVKFVGGISARKAVVEIVVSRRGGAGTKAELPFPAELGAPWLLDRTPEASTETEPFAAEDEKTQDPAKTRWERHATLVYWAATRPTKGLMEELAGGKPTDSYDVRTVARSA